jgi:hypothetical protein
MKTGFSFLFSFFIKYLLLAYRCPLRVGLVRLRGEGEVQRSPLWFCRCDGGGHVSFWCVCQVSYWGGTVCLVQGGRAIWGDAVCGLDWLAYYVGQVGKKSGCGPLCIVILFFFFWKREGDTYTVTLRRE